MKRAAAAVAILLSCVIACKVLSGMISRYSNEFSDLTDILYKNAENTAMASDIYVVLCDKWRDKEELFILLSGRVATAPIEEALSGVGMAIESSDIPAMKKELSALSSKFTEISEHNLFKVENLI